MRCDALRCSALLCYAMPCYAMLCYALVRDAVQTEKQRSAGKIEQAEAPSREAGQPKERKKERKKLPVPWPRPMHALQNDATSGYCCAGVPCYSTVCACACTCVRVCVCNRCTALNRTAPHSKVVRQLHSTTQQVSYDLRACVLLRSSCMQLSPLGFSGNSNEVASGAGRDASVALVAVPAGVGKGERQSKMGKVRGKTNGSQVNTLSSRQRQATWSSRLTG